MRKDKKNVGGRSASNLIGKKFGRLTVIKKTSKRKHRTIIWLCKCDCGNKVELKTNQLTTGHTKSCGCYTNQFRAISLMRNSMIKFMRKYKQECERSEKRNMK